MKNRDLYSNENIKIHKKVRTGIANTLLRPRKTRPLDCEVLWTKQVSTFFTQLHLLKELSFNTLDSLFFKRLITIFIYHFEISDAYIESIRYGKVFFFQ